MDTSTDTGGTTGGGTTGGGGSTGGSFSTGGGGGGALGLWYAAAIVGLGAARRRFSTGR